MERTRLIGLYLSTLPIGPETRILHMAPERGLYSYLSRVTGGKHYLTADFSPEHYSFAPECTHIDLCDLDHWESDAFDLILHSHVMEHTPCNIAYTMYHLDRMLAPGGRQICVIPFMKGDWDERFFGLSDAERVMRFGQNDHVRKFGTEDKARSLGKVMRLPETFDAARDLGREALVASNVPESQWRGFHGSTVLFFDKGDYLLHRGHVPDDPSPARVRLTRASVPDRYKGTILAVVLVYAVIILVAGLLLLR
jgi:phosphoglycolate phosphatase